MIVVEQVTSDFYDASTLSMTAAAVKIPRSHSRTVGGAPHIRAVSMKRSRPGPKSLPESFSSRNFPTRPIIS
jgi:hypothetical protein